MWIGTARAGSGVYAVPEVHGIPLDGDCDGAVGGEERNDVTG